jgi:hypothetical protein
MSLAAGGSPAQEADWTIGSESAAAASAPARSRISCEIFIEQYLGPHMLQKCADLKVSWGSVSSW